MDTKNMEADCPEAKKPKTAEYHDGDFDINVWNEEIQEIVADQMEEKGSDN